jgi:hypothetical protein
MLMMRSFLFLLFALAETSGFTNSPKLFYQRGDSVVALFSSKDDPTAAKNEIQPTNTNTRTSTSPSTSNSEDPAFLSQSTKGGFTVKQRLREEVESPFRKVRLLFFGSSVASASIALYFSMLSTIKAYRGGYADAPPLEEALTNDAINVGGVIVCGLLAFREYKAGEANLERIAKGGKLASLGLEVAAASGNSRRQVKDYRRLSRVLIAAGGEDYISKLCRSLTSDQLADDNILSEKLQETDVLVVPVLLTSSGSVGDTKEFWKNVQPEEGDRNMEISRADGVLAYPIGGAAWADYLKSEIETAKGQGFDVLEKGITVTVKKNGRILRRATGIPPWGDLIATMEVADGSRFGMPGDSQKYGGP